MIEDQRSLVVTGASSGIGYELARLAAEDGYDLVIVADEPSIVEAQTGLEQQGRRVEAPQVDLSTTGDAAERAGEQHREMAGCGTGKGQ
ncbi:MAG TPA: SDR family NAD(P)-dependent oxidoreductase [Caulobacter sp.]|nr:SDR family NAD(P)-dependent oxidoreductase [Caulobacter sp.]